MAKNYIAVGSFIFVERDETLSEKNGLILPDQAKVKPNTGTILSVGKNVRDKGIQEGRKAAWNRHVGVETDLEGQIVTVLREEEILGVS